MKTLRYDQTTMTLKDLEPSTDYIIRLSSNNKYGQSDGALLTKRTLPGKCYQCNRLSMTTYCKSPALHVATITIVFRKNRTPPLLLFLLHAST